MADNIRIRIIDTLEDGHEYTLEKAEGGTIILDWKGADTKDRLNIVGSSLSARMAKLSREDGAYFDLFTGDETRYRVIMDQPDDGYIIWQGFLLPDTYSEPYSNSPILVDVTATDGLGRLKGKFLPDEFYEEEKSVIDIIANCLKLTGLGLDFRFAPAIENYQQKDWNTIFLPGRLFAENEEKKDAYQILESLIPLNVIYQADNYWNIEGINVREQHVYTARVYDVDGVFIEEQEITRLSKKIVGTGKPDITMQPPYGVIEVTHEREPISFPEGLVEVDNDGWKNYDSYNEGVVALDWMGTPGFDGYWAYAHKSLSSFLTLDESNKEDITENVFFGREVDTEDDEQFISLRRPVYVEEGVKYKINLNFEIDPWGESETEEYRQKIQEGYFTNPFYYYIFIGDFEQPGSIIYNNEVEGGTYRNVAIQFDEELNSENEFTFIARKSGLLDIRLHALPENPDGLTSLINNIIITEAEIENLDFEDELVSQEVVNENYTLKKDINLTYSDGQTGFSDSYRLAKLDDPNIGQAGGQFNIVPKRQFVYDGLYHHSVSLQDANLVKENLRYTIPSVTNAEILDVVYNFQNSQEHVIITDIDTSTFSVTVYPFNKVQGDRDFWEQWTDSLFKIEKDRYNDTVVNIHKRMFDVPLASMKDLNVKNNVKFNDILGFQWMDIKDWVITNCKWDVDKGFTDVSVVQRYYTSNNPLLPPIVDTNDVQYYPSNQAFIGSEVYAPSGFIVSWQWEVLEGDGVVINNPNDQNVSISIPDDVEYAKVRVTVTDSNGNTSSDETELIKKFDVNLSVSQISADAYTEVWRLNPIEIGENAVLSITGKMLVRIAADNKLLLNNLSVKIRQNGHEMSEIILIFGSNSAEQDGNVPRRGLEEEYALNYRKGDVIEFEINVADLSGFGQTYGFFTIDYSEYYIGDGIVSGFPIKIDKIKNSQ